LIVPPDPVTVVVDDEDRRQGVTVGVMNANVSFDSGWTAQS